MLVFLFFTLEYYNPFNLPIIANFGEFFNCSSDEKGKLEHRFHLISLFPPFFEQDIKEKQSKRKNNRHKEVLYP